MRRHCPGPRAACPGPFFVGCIEAQLKEPSAPAPSHGCQVLPRTLSRRQQKICGSYPAPPNLSDTATVVSAWRAVAMLKQRGDAAIAGQEPGGPEASSGQDLGRSLDPPPLRGHGAKEREGKTTADCRLRGARFFPRSTRKSFNPPIACDKNGIVLNSCCRCERRSLFPPQRPGFPQGRRAKTADILEIRDARRWPETPRF
jgi:hypothetical protein